MLHVYKSDDGHNTGVDDNDTYVEWWWPQHRCRWQWHVRRVMMATTPVSMTMTRT